LLKRIIVLLQLASGHFHIAGQIGMVPADLSIIHGGLTSQARLSLRHVDRVLQAMSAHCGIKYLDLVLCYVTDSGYIEAAECEWNSFTSSEPACVSTRHLWLVISLMIN